MKRHERAYLMRRREVEGRGGDESPFSKNELMRLVMHRYGADYIAKELGVSRVLVYFWVRGERPVVGENCKKWWKNKLRGL